MDERKVSGGGHYSACTMLLLLNLKDLTRGELPCRGHHVPDPFLCVEMREEKEGHLNHGKHGKHRAKILRLQWHSKWIHTLHLGKERDTEIFANPQTVMLHICHDKLQRDVFLLLNKFTQIQAEPNKKEIAR